MQYSEHGSMHISFFGIFFIGAIVLFVVAPMIGSLVKGQQWRRPCAFLTTAGILALLFFGFFGLPRLQRAFPQTDSAVQHAPEISQQWDASPSTPMFESRFNPVWRKMLFLGLLLVVPITFALRFAHRRHWHAHLGRHGLFGLPLVLIALGLFFWTVGSTSVETPAPPVQVARQVERSSIPPNQYQGIIPVAAQGDAHKSKASAEKEAASTSTTSEPTSQSAEKPESDKAAPAENLPNWVHDSRQIKDDVYYEVVPLFGIVDPNIRTELMNDKLKVVMNHYIDDTLFHQPGASSLINISPDYLREKCNGGEFESHSGSGDAYFRLKLDKDFRGLVQRQYRTSVAQDRLQQLGTAGLVAFAALGGLYVFLRAVPKASSRSANADTAVPGPTA
jgi:hypothetical protein